MSSQSGATGKFTVFGVFAGIFVTITNAVG
jgi:hypothetical protein